MPVESMSSLRSILTRLAYRMPWDKWELTEEEFDILDDAAGEEIVTIAYRSSLNILRIVENADHLIIAHNDRNQKKILHELQKLSMFSRESQKEHETLTPTAEDVERRLLSETIDEVVGMKENSPPLMHSEGYSWANTSIEEILIRDDLTKDGFKTSAHPSFVDKVQNAVALSPSLNREELEAAGLNLLDYNPSDINQLVPTDELPEATNEILADMGIFTTSIGRQLFNKVNGIEEIEDHFDDGIAMVDDIEIPNLPDVPLNSPYPDVGISTMRTADKSQLNVSQRKASIDQNSTETESTNQTSVEKELEKIAMEAAERKKITQKALRAKRRKQKVTKEPVLIDVRNKPLKVQKHKPLVHCEVFYQIFIPLRFNVGYDDISDYQDDPPEETDETFADDVAMSDNENYAPISEILGLEKEQTVNESISMISTPLVSPVRHNTDSTPTPHDVEIPIHDSIISQNSEIRSRDSDSFSIPKAKRQRLETSETMSNDFFTPELPEPVQEFLAPAAPLKAPRLSSTLERGNQSIIKVQPQRKSQATAHAIAPLDMEFANWQHKSLLKDSSVAESSSGETNQERLPRSITRSGNDDEYDENGNHLFRRCKGKYDTMIEFVGVDGKVKKCSNYSMETLGLYLQIRFIMAEKNNWRMSINDLYPKISLLDANIKKNIFEMRLRLLSDFKLLTLTEIEDEIVGVEIHTNEAMEIE